jgi:hypothetical protein
MIILKIFIYDHFSYWSHSIIFTDYYDHEINDIALKQFYFTTRRKYYPSLSYFHSDNSNLNIKTYQFLNNYVGVVEPYQDMEIELYNDNDSDDYYYTYKICEIIENTKNQNCQNGFINETFRYECLPLENKYEIIIKQFKKSTNTLKSIVKNNVICQYVRREIRNLTVYDLNQTMNAFYQLWNMNEDDGLELYGNNYHTYKYLLDYHYFMASWQDADHTHEGRVLLQSASNYLLLIDRHLIHRMIHYLIIFHHYRGRFSCTAYQNVEYIRKVITSG